MVPAARSRALASPHGTAVSSLSLCQQQPLCCWATKQLVCCRTWSLRTWLLRRAGYWNLIGRNVCSVWNRGRALIYCSLVKSQNASELRGSGMRLLMDFSLPKIYQIADAHHFDKLGVCIINWINSWFSRHIPGELINKLLSSWREALGVLS